LYFVGVDSGGTKTAFVLADDKGRILARHRNGSGGFLHRGRESLYDLVSEGVEALCLQSGISKEDITFAGLGFPGYGEQKDSERIITELCEEIIGFRKVICNCDCHIGWAGSLGMEPGINIVAGTGSICYGVNRSGHSARSGGWGFYCDEGSCTWLGARLIEAFSKQADGRMPRTILYDMFRAYYSIDVDQYFIQILNQRIAQEYSEAAKLQMLLKKMYDAGDLVARQIYRNAADELWLTICAVAEKLSMTGHYFRVSYSGGLFRSGACILDPLNAFIRQGGGTLVAPRYSPEFGAVLMAMRGKFPDMSFTDLVFTE
jgi:N-acetylglucosamine kinase-like BadF-type ATPase